MLDKIREIMYKLEALGYADLKIKINSNTDRKMYSQINTGVKDGEKYGYIVTFEGIPVFIDDNLKDNEYKIEGNMVDELFYKQSNIPSVSVSLCFKNLELEV